MERWRCCDLWQRCLNHKWNSREFASALGVEVPELYWIGRDLKRLPIEQLPENVVLKPCWGDSCRGVYVLARSTDLMSGAHWDRKLLGDALLKKNGRFLHFPYLAEELLLDEENRCLQIPEYKFYMFGSRLGAIVRQIRVGRELTSYCAYDPDWTPIEQPFRTQYELDAPVAAPIHFEAMREAAVRIGKAYETFVRVDLYSTNKGAVFGELSSTPSGGKYYTEFANQLLGDLWQETIPGLT